MFLGLSFRSTDLHILSPQIIIIIINKNLYIPISKQLSNYKVPVKSVSPSLTAHFWSLIPHVHLPLALLPQAQAEPSFGTAFSTAALSQVHFKAAFFPQEQVDFLAQIHSAAEQVMMV